MGLPLSVMGKIVPGMSSIPTDKIFDKYFGKEKITDFDKFHIVFLEVCNEFNLIMPGKHYGAPPHDLIQDYFKDVWNSSKTLVEKKEALITLIKSHVDDVGQTSDNAIIFTGVVAPPAAMALKKSGENLPQLKPFRLNLIPDVVFVPSCTLLALIGVKFIQLKSGHKMAGK